MAKVALAAIRDEKTRAEWAEQIDVQANQLVEAIGGEWIRLACKPVWLRRKPVCIIPRALIPPPLGSA